MKARSGASCALTALLPLLAASFCPAALSQVSAPATPSQEESAWYFSWGYSRQHYARSDIHVRQPQLGNDFTVHQVAASDFPEDARGTIKDLVSFNFTTPQENLRIGRFLDPERTWAIEFSLDHTKYNTNLGQVVPISGTVNNAPVQGGLALTDQNFTYALHNGLNHIMLNAVWFQHVLGPERQTGELQFLGRIGAGILLPHAQNTIFGNENVVGPKNRNVCCLSSRDWWQLNGWTAGVELGFRYTLYRPVYLEFTSKLAYGSLHHVPVFDGTAEQSIWMSEQVLSLGTTF